MDVAGATALAVWVVYHGAVSLGGDPAMTAASPGRGGGGRALGVCQMPIRVDDIHQARWILLWRIEMIDRLAGDVQIPAQSRVGTDGSRKYYTRETNTQHVELQQPGSSFTQHC